MTSSHHLIVRLSPNERKIQKVERSPFIVTILSSFAMTTSEDDNTSGTSTASTFTTSSGSSTSAITTLLPNVLGSAAAGIIGRTFTHPLDTVKARLQGTTTSYSNTSTAPSSSSSDYRGPLQAFRQIYRHEGVRGLYRGYGTVIVAGTPGTILYLTSYDIFKEKIQSMPGLTSSDNSSSNSTTTNDDSFMVHFCAGLLAETVACLIYVPVDVIKERLQVQQAPTPGVMDSNTYYKNGIDAIQKISKTEGISGIYKGYGATLASFGPFSAMYFVFYEKCKQWSRRYLQLDDNHDDNGNIDGGRRRQQKQKELPFHWIILSSSCAGAAASFITSPLDMAKLRLQVQRAGLHSSSTCKRTTIQYRNMNDVLKVAYQQGGISGLFRGAGARVLHFVPATTVTMTSYETCRSFFQQNLSSSSSSSR
jgi:hypothetical protein